jgi:hypothetical protein
MEEKNVLNGVKQKFAEAREKCPGMSDDVYALTDYISLVVNDSLVPAGLSVCLALIMDDLQKGRNGFGQNEPLPEYLNNRKEQIIAQMVYIPQVVDAIADEKFAEEFREICKDVFGFNPPKRVKATTDSQYPENVRAAVDWWGNAVQSPKLDNGGDIDPVLMMMLSGKQRGHSEEEMKIFKDSLAKDILVELQKYGRCSLSVDYHPCEILYRAGEKIGLDNMTGYPWKTWMDISEEAVEVLEGYGAPRKTIWSSEKKEDFGETPGNNPMHK